MSADWITEGTAHRTRVRIDPVRHLLVQENGDWRLWCSYGKGRRDSNPHSPRYCRGCRQLALDAIEDDTLDPEDVAWGFRQPFRVTRNGRG